VLDWSWSESKFVSNTIVLDGLPKGKYEARLFLNNSFILEGKTAFSVAGKVEAIGKVQNAGANKVVTVTVNKHSSDDDWVGIFKKGVEKKWGNQIAWSFVKGKNRVTINPGNKLPAGEYEVALFLDNSLDKVEASVGFVVTGEVVKNVYGKPGPYLNNVKVNNDSDKYVVYYPEGHVDKAPLVLVMSFSNTVKRTDGRPSLVGLMTYLASKGCYVIGHKEISGGIGWDNISNTEKRRDYFIGAVQEAKNLGVDTDKLAIVGKSAGGMHTYALMKYFKGEGYGGTKSFILDLMGFYAFDMNKNDLETLGVDTLILHYGGKTGVQTHYPQDPRTLITISKLLKQHSDNVGFITIETKKHSYEAGTYNDIKDKDKLLKPIDAMFKYEFFNNTKDHAGQYNDARKILFDKYDITVQESYNATMQYIGGGTSQDKYGETKCQQKLDINYCTDHGLQ